MKPALAIRKSVEEFWNNKPCDSDQSAQPLGTKEYFSEIESDRYRFQSHIVEHLLPMIDWRDKDVLEIGTGVGTDARSIIARGARYTGINIDQASVDLTTKALQVFGLPGRVERCDATALRYDDETFDIVYSFGAFPCIPDLERAIQEIYRVLRPGGEVMALLYNRESINYHIEIMFLRRLFRHVLLIPGMVSLLSLFGLPRNRLEGHRELLRRGKKMSAQEWLSRNTDGPDNPYISVQNRQEAEQLFSRFQIVSHGVYFFDYRHWGLLGRLLPRRIVDAIGRRWGWHRIVHARKPASLQQQNSE